jgi:predicted small integral membrane protein
MMVIRAAKAALVAAVALLAGLVAFGNLTDYNTNFAFVRHVLSMDTIYSFSTIRYRAIGRSSELPCYRFCAESDCLDIAAVICACGWRVVERTDA